MKIALTLAYDGTSYFGSQIQKETPLTIVGVLSKVLQQLGITDKVIASGRTDKGVHATGQVCHLSLPSFWNDVIKLQRTLNTMLPPDISVKKVVKVDENFHARYSAKKRVYRYVLKEGISDPFLSRFITFEKSVDIQTIAKNIKLFEGEHDFSYYMKTGSQTQNNIRTIYKAYAYKYKDFIVLYFEANGFLRTQIRFMVGALLNLNKKEIQDKLSLTYNHSLKPAKSQGLYLAKIKY